MLNDRSSRNSRTSGERQPRSASPRTMAWLARAALSISGRHIREVRPTGADRPSRDQEQSIFALEPRRRSKSITGDRTFVERPRPKIPGPFTYPVRESHSLELTDWRGRPDLRPEDSYTERRSPASPALAEPSLIRDRTRGQDHNEEHDECKRAGPVRSSAEFGGEIAGQRDGAPRIVSTLSRPRRSNCHEAGACMILNAQENGLFAFLTCSVERGPHIRGCLHRLTVDL
jgi:hypothetical protein